MVEYVIKPPPPERLGAAVAEALDEGMTRQELLNVVTTTLDNHVPPEQLSLADACEDFQALERDTVYTELPPGLVTSLEAARKYGVNRHTVKSWIRAGKLPVRGRLKGSAPGGGFLLVEEQALVKCMKEPQTTGRPRGAPSLTD